MEQETPEFLTVREFAALVRAPEETVRYWVWKGIAPRSVKVGRRRLFARSDIDAWLQACGAA
jgi:excisionase family DNA binding protein